MSALRIGKLILMVGICLALSALTPLVRPVWAAPKAGTYIVGQGDTLFNISRRFQTDVATLQRLNGLTTTTIRIGQVLTVPDNGVPAAASAQPAAQPLGVSAVAPVAAQAAPATGGGCTYTVQAGEGLMAVARKHGINVAQLAAANGLSLNARLALGQVLRIPTASCGTFAASALPIAAPQSPAPAIVAPAAPAAITPATPTPTMPSSNGPLDLRATPSIRPPFYDFPSN